MVKYAVISAGGLSTRFRPYSYSMPKEILPIDGIPAVQYAVEECLEAGIMRIIIVTRPNNRIIYEYFYNNPEYREMMVDRFSDDERTQLLIIPEDESLRYGNAAPLFTVKEIIENDKFVVIFADDIIVGANPLIEIENFGKKHPNGFVVGYQNVSLDEVHNYGNIITNEENEIISIRQKPKDNIISTKVIVSRLLLDASIFDDIPDDEESELDLGLALSKRMQKEKHKVYACYLNGIWLSIDSPDKYLKALNIYDLMKKKIQCVN